MTRALSGRSFRSLAISLAFPILIILVMVGVGSSSKNSQTTGPTSASNTGAVANSANTTEATPNPNTTPAVVAPETTTPPQPSPEPPQQPSLAFPEPTKTTDCHSVNGLPDSACTPGAIDPRVTQDNIKTTICVTGYTATVRPTVTYTNKLKVSQIQAYGYTDTRMSSYEEDHLIPLEIGGSPDSPNNLWPEPYTGTYGAKTKDKVENYLHAQICNGTMTLSDAQHAEATNWEVIFDAHFQH